MLHIKVPLPARGEGEAVPYLIREWRKDNNDAPSPQSSPPAGRGGVYSKIALKIQIAWLDFTP